VKRIVETVEDVEVSRLDKRLPVGPVGDELDRISATINNMLARLEEGYARERQFTGDASHELRNPLAKVIADIDVTLKKERDSSEYRETLVRCRGYARGMERLVESLLWLARLPVAPQAMNGTTFELTNLAAETVGMLPEEEAARIQLELDDVGRSIHVRGKPELIRVMLQNLLQNALRYSPGTSPVTLRLAVDGDLARIDVQDHGDGIPEEDLEHVFSRFFRVDRSRARQTGGFGLGLAIVEEIAKEHGADVRLRNQSEGGLAATFHLELAALG
jgi:two-component system OmpR family sensor kinase